MTEKSLRPRKRRRTRAEIERARKKAIASRKYHLKKQHGMSMETYDAIKDWQEGVCPICRRANGRTKELAVDHDHKKGCHPGPESCPECWRGEICSPCNSMFAHARDEVEFFERAIHYLKFPPAQQWRQYKFSSTGIWPGE